MSKKFICHENDLQSKNFFIKFIDELKDEFIVIKDKRGELKCFSSVCPHLAGEVCYKDYKLYCRWHGLYFDENGKATNSKLKLSLRSYNLEKINGEIFIVTE